MITIDAFIVNITKMEKAQMRSPTAHILGLGWAAREIELAHLQHSNLLREAHNVRILKVLRNGDQAVCRKNKTGN